MGKIKIMLEVSPIISRVQSIDSKLEVEVNKFVRIRDILKDLCIKESEIIIIIEGKVVDADFLLEVDGQKIFLAPSLSGG